MIKMYNLELVRAPQHPRAAKTMMATPVPSKEREARESWKRSTEIINLISVDNDCGDDQYQYDQCDQYGVGEAGQGAVYTQTN